MILKFTLNILKSIHSGIFAFISVHSRLIPFLPYVTDPIAEVLGLLTVNGEPGLSVKKTGNEHTVFCAVP